MDNNPTVPGDDPAAKVKEILDQVLDLPVEQRSVFLDGACGGDIELRREVESLLEAPSDFLANPTMAHRPIDPGIPSDPPRVPSSHLDLRWTEQQRAVAGAHEADPGAMIGRYHLLEKIGEGGWGAVYVAEQKTPVRRRVALKLIKLGMDTKQVIARFEAERQALAMMDHPNIAKVLDAGATENGRPYFVMELVRGIPITSYCALNHLAAEARVKLFIQICNAVQHAHQKGIIHRDLKPSNILVTLHDGVPVPMVIDFGIAKATQGSLTDKTVYTQFQQFIGTPAYMSPEQAEMSGLDIDTRSDIYSLGVLLYELLTDKTPFDPAELLKKGLDEMRRVIREQDPVRPSTRLSTMAGAESTTTAKRMGSDMPRLLRTVRGDLDCIVMKCLEKDRARRYETANGLAMDIERHLNNEPVIARPVSSVYRFRKMVRRNKVAFAAGSAVLVALLIGLGISTVLFVREHQARQRAVAAEREQSRLREDAVVARATAMQERGNALAERATAVEERAKAEQARNAAQSAETVAKNSKADFRRHLYNTQMTLAGQKAELPSGIPRVLDYLEPWREWNEGEPDLRGWEWYYLNALSHPALMTLSEDRVSFNGVGWSPDGARLASGDRDGMVRIWDAASGKVLLRFAGHAGSSVGLAWSPDGARLATSSEDGVVKVWNSQTGNESFTHRQNTRGSVPLAWNPDGKSLAVGQGSLVVIRSSTDGTEVRPPLRGHSGWVTLLAWTRDGKRLASGGRDFYIRVWDPNTGAEIFPPLDAVPSRGAKAVTALAWNPAGTQLASAGGEVPVRIWDISTSNAAADFTPIPGTAAAALVAWDRSGKHLVTAGADQNLRVWDASNFTAPLFTLQGHTGPITSVRWNPDGTKIASASHDGTVRVWASAAPAHVRVVGRNRTRGWITWSADGKQLISGGGDSMVRIWDVSTSQKIDEFQGSPSGVDRFALDADGRRLAVMDATRRLRIVDAATGEQLKELFKPSTWVMVSLAWSPDGKRLASGGADKIVRMWDVDKATQLFTFSQEAAEDLRWSPDGKRLAVTDGHAVKIRDADTGNEILTLGEHTEAVTALAWSPDRDGTQLASASNDGTVKIWPSAGGDAIHTLRGHTGQVLGVTWSPDGTRVATASRDLTIKIWNPTTGQELFTYHVAGNHTPGLAGWSRDGTMLAFTCGTNETGTDICVLDATSGYALARLPTPVPATRPSSGDELVQQHLQEYLAFLRKYRDEAHPDVVATLAKLGASLQQSGKLSEAEPLCRQVIRLRRQSLGDSDVNTRSAVRDMAGLVIAHLKQFHDTSTTQPATRVENEGLALLHRLEPEYADSPELLSVLYLGLIQPLLDFGLIDDAKMLSRKVPALNPRDVEIVTDYVASGVFSPYQRIASEGQTLTQIARRFADPTTSAELDIPLAIELAQSATKCAPTMQPAWLALGIARYRNGEFMQAVADLEKASTSIECYFFLAMAYHRRGETDLARAWYTFACQAVSPALNEALLSGTRAETAKTLDVPENWPVSDWSPKDEDLRVYRHLTELNPQASWLSRIVDLLLRQGKSTEAAMVIRTVLDIQIATLGPEDRFTVQSMNNLAAAYYEAGQYKLGLPLAKDTVRHYRKLPPTDDRLVRSMGVLADLCDAVGQHEEALAYVDDTLKLANERLRPGNLIAPLNLIYWFPYRYAERLTDAQPLFAEAVRRFEAGGVKDTADVADAKNTLGWSFLVQGKFPEAELRLREAFVIRETKLVDDWRRFETQSLLGAALAGQKKNMDEADRLLHSGYEGMKQRESRIPIPTRKRILEAAERLAQFYKAVGNAAEADKWHAAATIPNQ